MEVLVATILSGLATLIAAITARFAYNQANLLKKQIQLQAILDLDREWNFEEMMETRASVWTDDHRPKEDKIEDLLEFLEKVSSLEERGIIDPDLIWDTFGWYMIRYYRYCAPVIEDVLRRRWTHKPDPTLYQDLQSLYEKLVEREARERSKKMPKQEHLTREDVEKELDDPEIKQRFVDSERSLRSDANARS